jgi:hypothetical protein
MKNIFATPPPMVKEVWSMPIPPGDIDIDSAKLIIKQAQDRMNVVSSTAEDIVKRTFTLTAFLIAISTALFGFAISKLSEDPAVSYTAFATFAYTFIILIYCGSNLFYKEYFLPGALPADMCTADRFRKDIVEGNFTELYLHIGEIETLQSSIEYNTAYNRERARVYGNSLKGTMIIPLVMAIGWLVCLTLF